MSGEPIRLDELDWKFAHLERGAAALRRGCEQLADSSFRSFLYTDEAVSPYGSRMYGRLLAIHTDYWKFRLALLWDLFPNRRRGALDYCRDQYEGAIRTIESLQRERPQDIDSGASDELAGARVLLTAAKHVSTEAFAEATAVLAARAAFYCSWFNGPDEWETLMAFYQTLDAVLVPEQVERPPRTRAQKRH